MKHSFPCFAFSLLLLAACSGEKASHETLPAIQIEGNTEHFESDYTSEAGKALFKNPKTLQLETKDECLLSGAAGILDVTSKYIVVSDDNKVYFFDAGSGAFLSKIARRGDGPEEYSGMFFRYYDEEKELVHISTPSKIKSYRPDGTFVSEYRNNDFANLAGTTDGYWGLYPPGTWGPHLFAFLDKNWQVKKTFLPHRNAALANKKMIVPPRMRVAENHVYSLVDDTLYANKEDELLPALVLRKGKLKFPMDILGLIDVPASIMQMYIRAEEAFVVGDFLFYQFFFGSGRHFTVWNIGTGELLTHSKSGYFLPFNEETTLIEKISLCKNRKVYTLLSATDLAKYGLADAEDDSNPLLLSVELED